MCNTTELYTQKWLKLWILSRILYTTCTEFIILPQWNKTYFQRNGQDRAEYFHLSRNSMKQCYTRYVVTLLELSEKKKILLPTECPLHLVFAIMRIVHTFSTPSFILCLHVCSILQLDFLVAPAYRSSPPCPQASRCRERRYVSIPPCLSGEALWLNHAPRHSTAYIPHLHLRSGKTAVLFTKHPSLCTYHSWTAQLAKFQRFCFCPSFSALNSMVAGEPHMALAHVPSRNGLHSQSPCLMVHVLTPIHR